MNAFMFRFKMLVKSDGWQHDRIILVLSKLFTRKRFGLFTWSLTDPFARPVKLHFKAVKASAIYTVCVCAALDYDYDMRMPSYQHDV